jgi:hypothetical protein
MSLAIFFAVQQCSIRQLQMRSMMRMDSWIPYNKRISCMYYCQSFSHGHRHLLIVDEFRSSSSTPVAIPPWPLRLQAGRSRVLETSTRRLYIIMPCCYRRRCQGSKSVRGIANHQGLPEIPISNNPRVIPWPSDLHK